MIEEKACLQPTCEDNLESKVYEEIHRIRQENGEDNQRIYNELYERINLLENKLSIALRIIDRDFVKREKNEQ